MGLSIHYQGCIKDYALVDVLTNEVEDICKSLDWRYHIWAKENFTNDKVHINCPEFLNYTVKDLKGISISPKDCEPIELNFLPSGLLCSAIKMIYNTPGTNELMIEAVSTKTQFVGIDTHIAIINLLQYLSDKYFSSFKLSDEGHYWETKDKNELQYRFDLYNSAMDILTDALDNFEAKPGETTTSLADRLEELLKRKFGPDKKE